MPLFVPTLAALVAVVSVAPHADSDSDQQGPRVELLVFDIEGVDTSALDDALGTRLPDRRRIRSGDPAARAGVPMWGYVQIRDAGDGWTLALILSDGRAYYRDVDVREGGSEARLLATTLSNLLASVEEDALPPDEEDVAIPDVAAAPEPPVDSPPKPPDEPEPRPKPPQSTVEFGPFIGAAALLALGPPVPAGFSAAGGSLGLDVRFAKGVVVGGELRGLGLRRNEFGVARVRAGVHGGYAWRLGRFEWLTTLGVTVEPWFVRAGGRREPLRPSSGESQRSASALGGALRLVPSFRGIISDTTAFRLGPALQLAGSTMLGGGGGVAVVRDSGQDPAPTVFRVGGLELSAGIELGFWIARGAR